MKNNTRTAAVITAAGLSTRMHDFKPLLPLGDETIIGHLIRKLKENSIWPIVVVTGFQSEKLTAYLTKNFQVRCICNQNYQSTQMFDSMKLGLEVLEKQTASSFDKILLSPADLPCFRTSTLWQIISEEAPVVIPVCRGRKGHPVCIRRELLPEILAHDGTNGLKGALARLNREVCLPETEDPGILADADTPEDYEHLKKLYGEMTALSFDALIVAAGKPRLHSAFSPAQSLGSLSVIRRIIHTFKQAGASSILVVTGYQAEELERHLARSGVILIRNENWESTDMMESVKLGLSRFNTENGFVFFTPADIPLFTLSTLKRLLKSDAPLAVPGINGKCGHPLLLSKKLIPALLSYKGNLGLRDALEKTGTEKKCVEVNDEGILLDVENETDFNHLLERHNRQPFCPRILVSLERELSFFDRDTAMLLRLIEQVHSVRKACSLTGLSYSKGWKILNEMEVQSGITIICRRAGGQTGGKTELTEEGLNLLERFETYEKRMNQLAVTEFYRIFPEMDEKNE